MSGKDNSNRNKKDRGSYYKLLENGSGFIPCELTGDYPTGGSLFRLSEEIGGGYFWYYESPKKFNIKIHDFWFKEDTVLNMQLHECLSVTRYDSISGEELAPYRKLRSNVIKSFLGGYKPYRALIHKNVPIRSVGIEYHPDYYNFTLKEIFKEAYINPSDAFFGIDETSDFPEMMRLLWEIKNYRGDPVSAVLFYEGKAAEALSQVFDRYRTIRSRNTVQLSSDDRIMLDTLASYIGDHYADDLTIEGLSKISYMGTTKLKKAFKIYFECTINEYIQNIRLDHAEHLLAYTDLSVGDVAKAVGYSAAGHFASLFCKHTGVLPLEYRKSTRR